MNEPVQPQPAKPANPFSVVTALSDTFTYVVNGFVPLLRLSWKFLAFVLVAGACVFVAIGLLARQENNETAIYVVAGAGLLLGFLVSVAYYIVVVRNWMLGEPDPRFLPVYGRFLLRVVVLTVLMLLVMAAIFGPVLAIGIVGIEYFMGADDTAASTGLFIALLIALVILVILAVLVGIYVVGRLCPWMVAAAIEQPQTLGQAWRETRGAGLRILAGMLGLTILFLIADLMIEAALTPLLGLNSEAFEKIAEGVSLPALFGLFFVKMLVYFPQTAASMIYCGSIYRQTSGR